MHGDGCMCGRYCGGGRAQRADPSACPGFPRPEPAPLRRGPAEVDEDDQTCIYHNLHLSRKGTYLQKGQRTEQGGLQTCNRTARSLEPVPWAVGTDAAQRPDFPAECLEQTPVTLTSAPPGCPVIGQSCQSSSSAASPAKGCPCDSDVANQSLSVGFAMDTAGRDSFSSLSLEL